MKTVTPRQQKFASVYDGDIWPLVPRRAGEAILRHLPRLNNARVLDVGGPRAGWPCNWRNGWTKGDASSPSIFRRR